MRATWVSLPIPEDATLLVNGLSHGGESLPLALRIESVSEAGRNGA